MTFPVFSSGEVLRAQDMNAVAMWRVGGGTLSGAATNIVGCFTSDYTNYRVVIDSVSMSAPGDIYYKMLSGTTPTIGANYDYAFNSLTAGGAAATVTSFNDTFGYTGLSITGSGLGGIIFASCSFDIYMPQLNNRTPMTCNAASVIGSFYTSRVGMSVHNTTAIYDGIRLDTRSAVTMTGTVSVYGYRKA